MAGKATRGPSVRRAFGAQVRHIRKSRGLTQVALGAVCKLDRTYIGGIERGEQNPSLECIAKIAKSLGVPAAGLFAEVDKES
jgi:transcriptional regulator with XRE-family HTH domain